MFGLHFELLLPDARAATDESRLPVFAPDAFFRLVTKTAAVAAQHTSCPDLTAEMFELTSYPYQPQKR